MPELAKLVSVDWIRAVTERGHHRPQIHVGAAGEGIGAAAPRGVGGEASAVVRAPAARREIFGTDRREPCLHRGARERRFAVTRVDPRGPWSADSKLSRVGCKERRTRPFS